jgi:hypothetical protein
MSEMAASFPDSLAALYQLHQLDADRREIRLIVLQPGTPKDPIVVELKTGSLNDNISYETISYAWGDETHRSAITISGLETSVTANLGSALRHMRLQDQPRVLWADAICINQSDIPEKNIQVRHMGEIYMNCSKCLVWLGEEDEEDGQTAFDFIEELSRGGHIVTSRCYRNPDSRERCRGKFPALARLMRRPWWSRAWVVQEALLPTDVEYWCGDRIINISTLIEAGSCLSEHFLIPGCCRDPNTTCSKQCEDGFRDAITLADWVQSGQNYTQRAVGAMQLWYPLIFFRSRLCQNPLDKVLRSRDRREDTEAW